MTIYHAHLVLTFSIPNKGEKPTLVRAGIYSEPAHVIPEVFGKEFYAELLMESGESLTEAGSRVLETCRRTPRYQWVLDFVSTSEKELFK